MSTPDDETSGSTATEMEARLDARRAAHALEQGDRTAGAIWLSIALARLLGAGSCRAHAAELLSRAGHRPLGPIRQVLEVWERINAHPTNVEQIAAAALREMPAYASGGRVSGSKLFRPTEMMAGTEAIVPTTLRQPPGAPVSHVSILWPWEPRRVDGDG